MKIRLNNLTMIMSFESDSEKKLVKKFITFKDDKGAFFGGKFHPERVKDVCLGKEIREYFVCFAGLCKEILLFCKQNGIKITSFEDKRTHFDFQKKEWTHDELRKFFNPNFKYVEHQIRAIEAMIKTNTGLVVAPTSAGKSTIMSAFIRLVNMPTLILVNKVMLGEQLRKGFLEEGIDCGICSGKGVIDGKCMVSTIQSVKKLGDLTRFKMVLADECFPGNTKIMTENGLKNISKIVKEKSTEKVYSFNKETKKIELKPISNWMEKKSEYDTFIRVYTSKNNNVVSTPNHKYYVFDNNNIIMKRADELKVGDKLYSHTGKNFGSNSKWHAPLMNSFQKQAVIGMIFGDANISLANSTARLRFSQGEKQLDYLNHKINILRNLCGEDKPYFNKSGYNQNNKIYYKATKTSDEFLDLYNLFYCNNGKKSIKNILNLITEISLAYWIMDDGYCYKYDSKIGQRCQYNLETQCFDEKENDLIIDFFKNKFNLDAKKYFDERCEKWYIRFSVDSSIKISQMIRKYVPDCMNYKLLDCDIGFYEENKEQLNDYCYKTVLKIEKYKPKYNTVYNITVDDNHNYFVGYGSKLLVSNCHNVSAGTFQEFFTQFGCPLKFGFSASPFRNGDYLGYAKIRQFLGSPIIKIESQELLENEVMAKPHIYLVKNQCLQDDYFDYQTAYTEEIVNGSRRNLIVKDICDKYGEGVLVLVNILEHGKILEELIPDSKFIAGETPIDERLQVVDDFDKGKLPILIASTILQEGISITHMKAMVLACGGKSNIAIIQKIGRSLRFKEGEKTEVDYYDFVDTAKFLNKHSKMRVSLYKKTGYTDINLLNGDLEPLTK